MVGAAETQRVEVRDRARTHGENVAEDAADPGRRALIGLDVRRVVVALHLEDRGELLAAFAFAAADDAGRFAGDAEETRGCGREVRRRGEGRMIEGIRGEQEREGAEREEVRSAQRREEEERSVRGGRARQGAESGGG